MRVLVVEDDLSIRETLGMVLESFAYQADLMENGERALEYLSQTWPDVMLLDLTLPGTNGEDIYTDILKRFGKVPPTIVLSAAHQGKLRAQDLPGALFLSKPYTIEDLEQLIETAIATPGAA
jgi:DNA-binding response OmpR family regulator